MNIRYRVELSQAECDELNTMLRGGKHAARKLKRAQILLAADAGSSDEEIARVVGVGGSTVYRTKRRFVEGNLECAMSELPRPGGGRKLTGKEEALLVATACSNSAHGWPWMKAPERKTSATAASIPARRGPFCRLTSSIGTEIDVAAGEVGAVWLIGAPGR